MKHHFPGCDIYEDEQEWQEDYCQAEEIKNLEIEQILNCTTKEKIKWAIDNFKPYKSPGEDKIFPALLRKGGDKMVIILQSLYRHSLILGYVPKIWR